MDIRAATLEDTPAIQAVGRSAWYDTYGPYRSKESIEYGLENWWSQEHFAEAIGSDEAVVLVDEALHHQDPATTAAD